MNQCPVCQQSFSRRDAMLRHQRNVHDQRNEDSTNPSYHSGRKRQMRFQHPFTMVVSGPSGSGKTQWTKRLLSSSLIRPSPQRVIWCYGQWQPLYRDLKKSFQTIQFFNRIPDDLNNSDFLNTRERNLIVLDDLMTEAKCDQRIADLFTKGRHHRNVSVVYLTQNLFPQGKACRDIALNTQYMVLFNNPIDRQQVATLAKRIYPSDSARFMNQYKQAVQRPYGYLVVDLKSCTPEHSRLRSDIFGVKRTLSISDTESDLSEAESSPCKRLKYTRDWIAESKQDDASTVDWDHEPSDKDLRMMAACLKERKDVEEGEDEEEDVEGGEEEEEEETSEKNDKVLRNLIMHRINQEYGPHIVEKSQPFLETGDNRFVAECKAINDMLPEIRERAKECLSDVIEWMYCVNASPLYQSIIATADDLHTASALSLRLAFREAVRIHKSQLDTILIPEKDIDTIQANT